MKPAFGILAVVALALAGCGASTTSPSASASRGIVISSTNTPGPAPSRFEPADPVSTVLTPFATSTAGPGSSVASPATPAPSAANQVRIQDFSFTPPTFSVSVGTRVSWTNGGPSNHTVTANDGSFDSGTIQRNGSFSFTFTKAGTFAYHCSLHPTMTATITVA